MPNPTDGYNPTAEQQQNMDNLSFDREFKLNTVENLVYNQKTGKIDRMVQPGQTLPTSGLNPSTALSYDENGDLQYIDETIGTTTYRTTLTYIDRVLTGISAAVEL